MRKCNCSGHCGPHPDGITRRQFLEWTAAGAASAVFASSAFGKAFELSADELQEWKRTLLNSQPRLYRSEKHTDARLHLGGIGTGNFEIGVDGQFTRWQLFNTLRDGTVPLHFAVRAGDTARLLQTGGGPEWPRIRAIEMTGEYPFARLRFQDPALPIELELEAFTPFAPLDAAFSSQPLAAFTFRLRNGSDQKQEVSLAAFMQNPVGYDAQGENDSKRHAHPAFGGNINEPLREEGVAGLLFTANTAPNGEVGRPLLVLASPNLKGLQSPPADRPAGLEMRIEDPPPTEADGASPGPASTLVWLEDASNDLSEAYLKRAVERVRSGATLLFSGTAMPLLRAYAAATGGKPLAQATLRPDIVFEDFENGYDRWMVEGEAFGKEPAHGTLPNQQRVSGFLGTGLVNTYLHGDDTTGMLTSKPFLVERHFVRFLIGGGHFARTQIRLLVDGKVVRSASGRDNERLEPASWEVRELEGKTAHLEIVDEQKGGWGHINVDQITFSDQPANAAVFTLLEQILPAHFSAVTETRDETAPTGRVHFEDLAVIPGTRQATTRSGLSLLERSIGNGKVLLVGGPILNPSHAEWSVPRRTAYATLCELAGVPFRAGQGQSAKAPGFGSVALAVLNDHGTVLTAFDDWTQAWQPFTNSGRFASVESAHASAPSNPGRTNCGAVATTVALEPGATVEVPFLLTWHYPNKYNREGVWMGCHYATRWNSAREVLRDGATQFASARARTELFRRALYDSTLPYWLLDCLTSNAAIARHIGVVFRIANADVYGWEGSNGCCDPTCTHVWGYEQSFARLFPELERDMRRIDFQHQQRPDGGVNNRTHVPSPSHPTGEQPFADGHASCVLKAYREALNSPDDSFLREYWPHARRAVEYLVARDARAHGGEPAGYLEDDQWNTYDEALHGVTTFISGYYLAALRVGEEWARRMGESEPAELWHALFLKGQAKVIELCWNGEYFQQHLAGYETRPGEVGPGCMADQLIGQWWAHQLGLGYILPRDKVVAALRSIYRYNFKTDLTGWHHMPRAFAGAQDKGLIICTWPKGGRPANVMLYSDEVWTGIEYQVAAHLIYEDLIEEGLAVAKAARDRYDGVPRPPIPRNPWDEIECGGHYARAMSSWTLLLALSGWHYDGPLRTLRFAPRHRPENCRTFWTGPAGWGTISHTLKQNSILVEIGVHAGEFTLRQMTVPIPSPRPALTRVTATTAGRPLASKLRLQNGTAEIHLNGDATIREKENIQFLLET